MSQQRPNEDDTFRDDATSVVDDGLLAEIRAEAQKRAKAGQAWEAVGSFASATAGEADDQVPVTEDPLDDDLPVVEGLGALREIGRGGFSRVYEALQFSFDRWVAVKVLNETLDGDEIAEFERECRLMGVLSRHPNIVTVLDSTVTDDGLPCIVMELFPNGSYLDVIQASGPLGLEELLSVAVSISGSLATAHRQGVVHGDVKPQNIFRSEFGAALGDFGIASLVNHGFGPAKTRLSLYYAAPEVIERGAAALSPFSDQYSLAATLYTLATGDRPFQAHDTSTTRELLLEVLTAPAPRLGPDFPTHLAEVVSKAMTREPALRYRDMGNFADAISQIETELGFQPTEMRVLSGSGRFAARTPGESRSSSRDLSSSRDRPEAERPRTATGPHGSTHDPEYTLGHGSTTIVRPVRPRSPEPKQTPPTEAGPKRRRKWPFVTLAALLLAGAGGVAAFQYLSDGDGDSSDPPAEVATTTILAPTTAEPEPSAPEPTVSTETLPPLPPPEDSDVAAPSGLTLEPSIGSLTVTWDAPEPEPADILHYRIEWGATGQSDASAVVQREGRYTVVPPSQLSYDISDLTHSTTHWVRVAALGQEGLGQWAQKDASTLGAPPAPMNLSAEAGDHGEIVVRWEAPEDPSEGAGYLTGYTVYWEGSDDGSGTGSVNLPAETAEYQITDLISGVEYRIYVETVGEAGAGDQAVTSATTRGPRRSIAFARSSGERSAPETLHIMDWSIDGFSNPVAYDLGYAARPRSWSPDGLWLVADVKTARESDWEIVAFNPETRQGWQLTCNSVDDWGPVWSPDGTRIAFVRHERRNHDLWLFDFTTGEEERLTFSPGHEGLPSWSPDGTMIAFDRKDTPAATRDIFVININADGSAGPPRPVTSDWRDEGSPSWSPDEQHMQIAYTQGASNGSSRRIMLVPAAGGSSREVTSGDYHDDHPRWSPDGKSLTFVRGTGRGSDIFSIAVDGDGGAIGVSEEAGADFSPAWTGSSMHVTPEFSGCASLSG